MYIVITYQVKSLFIYSRAKRFIGEKYSWDKQKTVHNFARLYTATMLRIGSEDCVKMCLY